MDDFDVVILGGGVAGLTLALQLKQRRPQTRIAVVEKRPHPIPDDAAFKVGESVAEVAAFYFKDVIGLEDYLREHQLRKMGLRFFGPSGDNSDISRRVEYGLRRFSPLWNFHLDRGHFENFLTDHAADHGVEVIHSTPVNDVALGSDRHHVSIGRPGQVREISGRWVIDATGRRALLRGKLGYGTDLAIKANTCWFRTPYRLLTDEWSDDPEWRAAVPTGTRFHSTTQLVGEGYWVWIINLASGATSVGVVADPDYVPFERIRRYDVTLEWLRSVEPQLAAHLPETEEGLLDFHKRVNPAARATRAFSHKRWALTGEAAVFLDPLYSSGLDFTAIANTLSTDLICREFDGDPDLKQRIRAYNRALLAVAILGEPMFVRTLECFRKPQVMGAKFLWDNSVYFTVMVNIFLSGGMTDLNFVRGLEGHLRRAIEMVNFMESQLREWASDDWDIADAGLPIGTDFMAEWWFCTPLRGLKGQELLDHTHVSLSRLHKMSREMVERFSEAAGKPVAEAPYDAPPPVAEQILDWAPFTPGEGGPYLTEGQSAWHAHRPASPAYA